MRYDFDSNLRSPDLIADLLANPQFAGLENMVTADRGNDLNNIQPRLGFAWDVRGDGAHGRARRLWASTRAGTGRGSTSAATW